MESTGFFFSKLTFQMNITFKTRDNISSCSYHMQWGFFFFTYYGVSSRKRPPPVSDHLGLTFWVVAYGRFDCIYFMMSLTCFLIAGFLMQDMRRNFLPKFIEICMEKPRWCPSVWAPTWRPETNRNICHWVLLQKREFIPRGTLKHWNNTFF